MTGGRPGEGYVVTGSIVTMDPDRPRAEAMAVLGDRIVAVGTREEARAALPAGAATVDAGDGAVVPGFIDTHNHMLWTAEQSCLVDLGGAKSVAEVLSRVADYAAANPDRPWIVSGTGWHIEEIVDGRYPTRDELDDVCGDRPVYLPRVGHSAVANSLALAAGGLTEDTPDPPGGKLDRGPGNGRLTGLLREPPAFQPIARVVPPTAPDEQLAALRDIQVRYHAAGITGVVDPGLTRDQMAAYQTLHAAGDLTMRTVMMPMVDPSMTPDELTTWLESWGVRSGFGDARLKIGGVKIFIDGGASLGTALMREPFPDEICNCGIQVTPSDILGHLARLCARLGWSLGAHVVGGRAIDLALETYAAVDREFPIGDLRFQLIHAYLWPTAENIATAARLNVGVATQPSMQYTFAPQLIRRFGAEAMGEATPIRSWRAAGVKVGGGSDSPITPFAPMLGLWHATTRFVDGVGETIGIKEAISADEALQIYTRDAAWLAFSEHERGMLRPGLLADWVQLSVDPADDNPDLFRDAQVLRTAVGGQIVHGA